MEYQLFPCDVGVLRVKQAEGLAKPLPLAGVETLKALESGQAIGFVGYPTESMFMHGVNLKSPTPTSQVNIITAVTDYLLLPGSFDDAFLIQHGLPLAGGASGSPMLNPRGEVVALVNAGNMASDAFGRRIATGVGVNFAVRSDLVRELMDGTATARNKQRLAGWKKQVEAHASIRGEIEEQAEVFRWEILAGLEQRLGTQPEEVREAWLWIPVPTPKNADTPDRGAERMRIAIAKPGTYVAFAYSANMDKFMFWVEDEQGGTLAETEREIINDGLSWDAPKAAGDAFLHIEGMTDTVVQFHVFRFPPRKP